MKFQMQANVDAPAICNQLLESEAAAIDAYTKASIKSEVGPRLANVLEHLRDRHLLTFESLSSSIRSEGVAPSVDPEGPQVLSYFAQPAEDSPEGASLIETLIGAEEHGKHLYEGAIDKVERLANVQSHIIEAVLPRLTENIVILRTIEE